MHSPSWIIQVQLPAYDDGSLIGGFTSAVKQSNPNVQTLISLYDPNSDLSTSFGVASWLKAGLSSKQAVLGLAVYGRSWILKNPSSDRGVGAAAVGGG
ncbi:hypothetical protein O6H91_Y421500 [Diphasiastrum complanatum]|nr:hypothetical protein O6H91_Y421500 [Diphasiastrum complanatum]